MERGKEREESEEKMIFQSALTWNKAHNYTGMMLHTCRVDGQPCVFTAERFKGPSR